MATRKKSGKATGSKTRKVKQSAGKKPAKKSGKKVSAKKASAQKTAVRRRIARGQAVKDVETVKYDPRGLGARSGGQTGDLQGLSEAEDADSESVGELLEEGNAFEAEVVKGVE